MKFATLARLVHLLDLYDRPYPEQIFPPTDGLIFGLPNWNCLILLWDKSLDLDAVHETEKILEKWDGWVWIRTAKDPLVNVGYQSVYQKRVGT